MKAINKKFKEPILGNKDVGTFLGSDYIPFPTPSLRYIFHGDMPTETIFELSGQFSSGKSSLCFAMTREAQQKFKADYDREVAELQSKESLNKTETVRLAELIENGTRRVLYVDAEMCCDLEYMEKCGIDLDSLIFLRPLEQSAEQILQAILDLMETGQIGFVVLDSIPSLITQAQKEADLEKKSYAGISAVLTTFSAKLQQAVKKYHTTFVGINQLRDVINSMVAGQKDTPGGRMWKHATHVRLMLRKGRSLDDKMVEIPNNTETCYGQTTEVQVLKNKISPFDRRLCKFTITPDCGVNEVNDTFMLGVALDVIKQSGAWYSIIDEETGEVKSDEDGTELKFQGKGKLIEYMKEHKPFVKYIQDEIVEMTK